MWRSGTRDREIFEKELDVRFTENKIFKDLQTQLPTTDTNTTVPTIVPGSVLPAVQTNTETTENTNTNTITTSSTSTTTTNDVIATK